MRNATEIDNLIYKNVLGENNSAFIFQQEKFRANLRDLKAAFTEFYPKVGIGYSYKTNYIPAVCLLAHEEGAFAEVVSEMEVDMAMAHLKDKSQVIFNGPVKSKYSLEKVVLNGGIVNIDNQKDLDIIHEILRENADNVARVAFRLNSDYNEDCSRFGQPIQAIIQQISELKGNPLFEIIGFHIHLPHRSLDSFAHRVEVLIETLNKVDLPNIKYINIGGGYYGQLSPVLKQALGIASSPSYKDYGKLIGGKLFEYFNNRNEGNIPTLYLEPGSSVIADCFTFVSKIHTIKSFTNRNILVSFAGRHLVSPTNKTIKLPCEIVKVQNNEKSNGHACQYEIAGYTCIESDILGIAHGDSNIESSEIFIEFTNVGSYSIVMGSNFILPEPPIFRLDEEYNLIPIRKERSAQDVLGQFV